ncbi:hypothetical protein AB0G86_14430 [Streptomyces scabiei]|uniref:hypothetical protein n=1 Tax=Streptomyces scabiei TaxID=1930 RepID=UPI0033CFD07F
MTSRMGPPVTPSAAAHAGRIRARTEERAAEQAETAAGQSTAERIAARVLPGYRADEALREQARLNELRARGVIAADPEPEDVEETYEEEVLVDEDDEFEDGQPLSTAERYAAVERERRAAEAKANRAAQGGALRTWSPIVGNQYPPPKATPHRYADRWPKPAA